MAWHDNTGKHKEGKRQGELCPTLEYRHGQQEKNGVLLLRQLCVSLT